MAVVASQRAETAPLGEERRWRSRPLAAAVIRVLVFLVPLTFASLTAYLVAWSLPPAVTWGQRFLWWVAVLGASVAVMFLTERLARRLLPLPTLLQLSLLFPGRAPRRLTVLRQSSRRQVRDILERLEEDDVGGDPLDAAGRVLVLLGALNRHDRQTRGHSERVRAVAEYLGQELHLDEADRDRLRWAALLHDVGKLFVPAEVLEKNGPLDAGEWEQVRRHPALGDRLIGPLKPWMGEWADAVVEHHERWDGRGYPNGLAGEEICLGARIVAVADAYDVMTAVRSYKPMTMTPGEAREELVRCSGTQFDPSVVRAFLGLSTRRLWLLAGPLAWLAQVPLVGAAPRLVAGVPRIGELAAVGGHAMAAVLLFAGLAGTPVEASPDGEVPPGGTDGVAGPDPAPGRPVAAEPAAPAPGPALRAEAAGGAPPEGSPAPAAPFREAAAGEPAPDARSARADPPPARRSPPPSPEERGLLDLVAAPGPPEFGLGHVIGLGRGHDGRHPGDAEGS